MPRYWFMYDTGVTMIYTFNDDEEAKTFSESSPDNLMFYCKETDDA